MCKGVNCCVLVDDLEIRNPIKTLPIPLQYPVLDHVSAQSSGVRVELGDDLAELLLGVLGIGGERGGDVAQDCEFLGQCYWNVDESAIGAEELVDLLSHRFQYFFQAKNSFSHKSMRREISSLVGVAMTYR